MTTSLLDTELKLEQKVQELSAEQRRLVQTVAENKELYKMVTGLVKQAETRLADISQQFQETVNKISAARLAWDTEKAQQVAQIAEQKHILSEAEKLKQELTNKLHKAAQTEEHNRRVASDLAAREINQTTRETVTATQENELVKNNNELLKKRAELIQFVKDIKQKIISDFDNFSL